MCGQCESPHSRAKTVFPVAAPGSVFPAAGTWAYELLRLQTHSSYWCSDLHTDTVCTHTRGLSQPPGHMVFPEVGWDLLSPPVATSSRCLTLWDTHATHLLPRLLHLLTRLDLWELSHVCLRACTRSRYHSMGTQLSDSSCCTQTPYKQMHREWSPQSRKIIRSWV